MDRLQIVLWKWKNPRKTHILYDFSSESVNRIRQDLETHLTIPHDVVCITDDASGIDSRIRVIPLWEEGRELGGCWTRLKTFSPEMRDLIGPRFAWIDLDCVIVGSLDHILGRTEDAVFYRSNSVPGTPYNGSIVLMNAGARAEVWDRFDPQHSPALAKSAGLLGTDQAWIAYVLGAEQPVWTGDDGVMHFARECAPDLPVHAKIVFFPGIQKPHMPIVRQHAKWVDQYWR